MFPTAQRLGGYLWKVSYKMSQLQKARQRKRLRAVDSVISTVANGLAGEGVMVKKLINFDKNLPKEHEMPSRDKYWVFAKYARGYRKGAHRVPKFTKVTNRTNPEGF